MSGDIDFGVAIRIDDAGAVSKVVKFTSVLKDAEAAADSLGLHASRALGTIERTASGAADRMAQEIARAQREVEQMPSLLAGIERRNASRNKGGIIDQPVQRDLDKFMETFEDKAGNVAKATDLISLNMKNVSKETGKSAKIFDGQLGDAIDKFAHKVKGIGTDIGKMAFGFAAGELVGGLISEIVAPTPPTDEELVAWANLADGISAATDATKKYAEEELKRREYEAHRQDVIGRQASERASVDNLIPDLHATEQAAIQIDELNKRLHETREGFTDTAISGEQYARAMYAITQATEAAKLGPFLSQVHQVDFAAREFNEHMQELMSARDSDDESVRISAQQYDQWSRKVQRAFDDAMLAAKGFSGEMANAILAPQQRYDDMLENEAATVDILVTKGYDRAAAEKAVNAVIEQQAKTLPGVSEAIQAQEQAKQKAAAASAKWKSEVKSLTKELGQMVGEMNPLIADLEKVREAEEKLDDIVKHRIISQAAATDVLEKYTKMVADARKAEDDYLIGGEANRPGSDMLIDLSQAPKPDTSDDAAIGKRLVEADRRMRATMALTLQFQAQLAQANQSAGVQIEEFARKYVDVMGTIRDVGVQALGEVRGALEDLLATGTVDFQKLGDAFVRMAARIATEALLSGLVGLLFGGGPPVWHGAPGGGLGNYAGGFADGGTYVARGSGGPDSQLYAQHLTPGERVTIETKSQQRSNDRATQVILRPTIINQFDRGLMIDVLHSSEAKQVILNVVSANRGALQAGGRG